MTALAVDGQRRRHTAPRRWRCLILSIAQPDSQFADLVEFNRLQPRIWNRQRFTGDSTPRLELVFGVRALSRPDEKLSCFASDPATHFQGVSQVVMAALIERAGQPIRGCTKSNTPCQGIFSLPFLDSVTRPAFAIRIRDAVRPRSVWPRLDGRAEGGARRV